MDLELRSPLLFQHTLFPNHAPAAPAPHHLSFDRHLLACADAYRDKVEMPARVDCWNRGAGKSSVLEMAVPYLHCWAGARYAVICSCHQSGTQMFDPNRPEIGWHPVDEHPSARPFAHHGLGVKIAGLPMVICKEVVTPNHPYWARRISSRQIKNKGQDTRFGRPQWVEAQDLDWNTWIGYPIDFSVIQPNDFPCLDKYNRSTRTYEPDKFFPWEDSDFWWLIGLWWGDGTVLASNKRPSNISFSCADKYPEVSARLVKIIERAGYHHGIDRSYGGAKCFDVRFADARLARWLASWREGKSRKVPPLWVEKIPLEHQRQLILGYLAADGNVDDRGAHLTSIHLPGLLAVRRMLSRLGIVCTIGTRTPPTKCSFKHVDGIRSYMSQRSYRLDIEHPADLGLPETVRSRRHRLSPVFIRDGFLWSRVVDTERVLSATFVAVSTEDETYVTAYGRSHNSTQDQADDRVGNIASLLSPYEADPDAEPGDQRPSPLALFYPELATPSLSRFGQPNAWRRSRLRTASGLTVDALGLDTAARGMKIENARPDVLCLDDVDGELDTDYLTERKLKALSRKILPALAHSNTFVFAAQNLILAGGVFARILGGRGGCPSAVPDAPTVCRCYLPQPHGYGLRRGRCAAEPKELPEGVAPAGLFARVRLCGPVPAVVDLETRLVPSGHPQAPAHEFPGGRTLVTAGIPTFPSHLPIAALQVKMDEAGPDSFDAEMQHNPSPPDGKMYTNVIFRRCKADLQGFPDPLGVPAAYPLDRIVCWVDPAVSDTKSSDCHAVQVDTLGRDRILYRLHSWERRASPEEALREAIRAAHRFGAEYIGIETDQGGDVWRSAFKEAKREVSQDALRAGETDLARYARNVAMRSAKAGSSKGNKAHRSSRMLLDYQYGKIVHVEGTHHVLEAALKRFPVFKPYDLADACVAEGSYVISSRGNLRIEDVRAGDSVLTREGFCSVLSAAQTYRAAQTVRIGLADGRALSVTEDHRVWTSEGWVYAGHIKCGMLALVCVTTPSNERLSSFRGDNMFGTPIPQTGRTVPTSALSGMGRGISFIEPSIALSSVRSQKGMTSTIGTATHSTMIRQTSNLSHEQIIGVFTEPHGLMSRLSSTTLKEIEFSRPHGIGLTKVGSGIGNTGGVSLRTSLGENWSVSNAERSSERNIPVPQNSALGLAGMSFTKHLKSVECALNAEKILKPQNTSPLHFALLPVVTVEISEVVGVHDLMVDGSPEFFANGILVHNSFHSWNDLRGAFPARTRNPNTVASKAVPLDPFRQRRARVARG